MFYLNRAFTLFAISILFLFAGCDGYMPVTVSVDFNRGSYDANLKKWKDTNIVNYKFLYIKEWDGNDYKVNVRNSLIESYSYSDYKSEVEVTLNSTGNEHSLLTIDELFDCIIREYNYWDGKSVIPNEESYCYAIDVKYNSEYGFPEYLSYEYKYPPESWSFSPYAASDAPIEIFYMKIKNFEPL